MQWLNVTQNNIDNTGLSVLRVQLSVLLFVATSAAYDYQETHTEEVRISPTKILLVPHFHIQATLL